MIAQPLGQEQGTASASDIQMKRGRAAAREVPRSVLGSKKNTQHGVCASPSPALNGMDIPSVDTEGGKDTTAVQTLAWPASAHWQARPYYGGSASTRLGPARGWAQAAPRCGWPGGGVARDTGEATGQGPRPAGLPPSPRLEAGRAGAGGRPLPGFPFSSGPVGGCIFGENGSCAPSRQR